MKKHLIALLAPLPLLGCSVVLLPPNIAPVVPTTRSVEQAEASLKKAAAERAEVEANYAAAEQNCYAKFFVNNCLDKAKEERRSRLAYLNAVENEAQYFQRKAKLEERDRKQAEAEKEFAESEARRAAEPPPAARADNPLPLPPPRGKLAKRQANRAARVAEQADKDRIKAAEAPANVAAFEQRRADSIKRQQRVAERQAERAKEQAARAAEQAKQAEEKAKAAKTVQPAK